MLVYRFLWGLDFLLGRLDLTSRTLILLYYNEQPLDRAESLSELDLFHGASMRPSNDPQRWQSSTHPDDETSARSFL